MRNSAFLAPLLALAAMAPGTGNDDTAYPVAAIEDGNLPDASVFLPGRPVAHRGLGGPVHSPGTKAHRAWKARRRLGRGHGGRR